MTSDISGVVITPTTLNPSAQHTQQTLYGKLHLDQSNGWIVWSPNVLTPEESIRLCFLPIGLRGKISASHESIFIVVSRLTHQLTVIDFAPMLESLCKKGFAL
jgi:hypothetical protein